MNDQSPVPPVSVQTHVHSPDCDWPQQKPLINYKLDQLILQFGSFNSKFDRVFTDQVKMSSENRYKQNFWPFFISVASLAVAAITVAVLVLQKHGP